MSETSRREFIAGVTKLAGVSAAATIAGGAPAVALGAVREGTGKAAITTPANAIVETSAGKVRGYVRNGIFTFKGIPYAGTTAGEARFLPPAPVTPWTQVRASMSYGPVCPQPVRGGWASDRLAFLFDWDDGHPGEDCLRLNVWTPAADDRSKRPVMVWLHGGGYEAGSSQELPSYDGENLSRRGDVVVVSVNHRLNVFGYLNMAAVGGEKYARSVNVGMLDIVAALQWVRDNVGRFGGDAANVTVFGQSGGAAKVNTLMAMPAAKGLFHKAIAQSGSQLRLATADASAAQAEAVLKELEAQGVGRDQLTQVPAARLVEIATVAKNRLVSTKPRAPTHERLGWQPWLDGSVVTSHPFDPQASPLAANVPMMIGTTMHEFSPAGAMPDPRSLTKEWLVAEVTKSYGDAAAGIVAAFERGPSRRTAVRARGNHQRHHGVQEFRCSPGAAAIRECSRVSVLVCVEDSGARRNAARVSLRRARVCIRQHRSLREFDRRHGGGARAGGEDEPGVDPVRAHRQSESLRTAALACCIGQHVADDDLRHALRGAERP